MAAGGDGAAGPARGREPRGPGAGAQGPARVVVRLHRLRADAAEARGRLRPDGPSAEAAGDQEGRGGLHGADARGPHVAGGAQRGHRRGALRRHPGGPQAPPGDCGGAHPAVLRVGPGAGARGAREVPGDADGEARAEAPAGEAAGHRHPPAAAGGGRHPGDPGERARAAGADAHGGAAGGQEAAGAGPAHAADGPGLHRRAGGHHDPGDCARLHLAETGVQADAPGAGVHRNAARVGVRGGGPDAPGRAGGEPGAAEGGAGGEPGRLQPSAGGPQAEGARGGGPGDAGEHPGQDQRLVRGEPRPGLGGLPGVPRGRRRGVDGDPESPAGGGGGGCAWSSLMYRSVVF